MQDIRVMTVAGDQLVADEVAGIVRQVLGEGVAIRGCPLGELSGPDAADLFVCVSQRRAELAKLIPVDKLVGIDLLPYTPYFIELAKLPRDQTVHVFGNTAQFTKMVADQCVSNGIDHLRFAYIPFEEITGDEVAELLGKAEVVIGPETLVGAKGALQQKYRQYLNPASRIIAAQRMIEIRSACELMKWVTLFSYRQLSGKVVNGMNHLMEKMQQISAITQQRAQSVQEETASFDKLTARFRHGIATLEQVKSISDTLSVAAKSIGNIVEAIKHISGQTNLLALNATFEAARVGEAGRGFAVVAKEVGKLAAESQTSTDTIRQAVGSIQAAVSEIVFAMGNLSGEMLENQALFAEISQASQQENTQIMEIFDAIENIRQESEEVCQITLQLTKSS
ncbi:methyl-accepting chemotaxis protein [Anaeroselena agilis]|uniref:Methyl-accepting chemotaxis protein n=1 Tax=Anaeroselena agilis TaxID=3063788 RepID=A0ABU3P2C3_9FIRM|nr:methyl-accepting chemotaxis protein [Selenomonadales bacterium 4137-cl]